MFSIDFNSSLRSFGSVLALTASPCVAGCIVVMPDPPEDDTVADAGESAAETASNGTRPPNGSTVDQLRDAGATLTSAPGPHDTQGPAPNVEAGATSAPESPSTRTTSEEPATASTDLSIGPPVSTSGGPDSSEAVSPDVSASTTSQTPSSTGAPTSDEPTCPQSADAALGVFVSPGGADDDTCGAALAPCASVNRGITRAVQTGKSTVYVASAQYDEFVELAVPVSLIGGWAPSDGTWTRECGALADSTIVQSPESIALRAQFEGVAELRSLTLKTKSSGGANNGESRYGIFATGASTRLELADVTVQSASANHGTAGQNGETLPAAGCTSGTGADGTPPSATPATAPGYFAQSGFVPGDGLDGDDGNPGQGGADGASVTENCTFCSMVNNQCQGAAGGQRTAAGGEHGCGGGPGTGGFGGTGGGASVGIFAWFATVQLGDDVLVVAGDGGDGALGGDGAAGESGTSGSSGEEVECNPGLSCFDAACGNEVNGNPGTPGGDGSSGADGGDGAGGWSVSLVGTPNAFSGNAATIFGQPGTSAGTGPTGMAQMTYTIE